MRHPLALTFALVSAATSLLTPAVGVAQQRVEVRVIRVVGSLEPASLTRALRPSRFIECQRTFMGGSVWLTLSVDASGALRVDRARTTGEENDLYVPCVRRVASRARFGAESAGATARVEVRFPSLGVATPSPHRSSRRGGRARRLDTVEEFSGTCDPRASSTGASAGSRRSWARVRR